MSYRIILSLIGFFAPFILKGQSSLTTIDLGDVGYNNRDFAQFGAFNDILQGKEVVMLGEQTHGEKTTYQTKMKLIQYLHEELDYDVLAFESSFYGCEQASAAIQRGEGARVAMAKGVFGIWSLTKEFEYLGAYIDRCNARGDSLKIVGFDSNFLGLYSKELFNQELIDLGKRYDSIDTSSVRWKQLRSDITIVLRNTPKQLSKRRAQEDIEFLETLIQYLPSYEDRRWTQILRNLQSTFSDMALGTQLRDEQMANNLLWIKQEYPGEKIVCWGATSHFIYNSREVRFRNPIVAAIGGGFVKRNTMMGHFVKEALQDRLYVIGFVAGEGHFGTFKEKELKAPIRGSIEKELMDHSSNNVFVPFDQHYNHTLKGRPLGHQYLRNDLSSLMDGIIFNRTMERPTIDKSFAASLYPDHPYFSTSAK